jgi:hypothetical protein
MLQSKQEPLLHEATKQEFWCVLRSIPGGICLHPSESCA